MSQEVVTMGQYSATVPAALANILAGVAGYLQSVACQLHKMAFQVPIHAQTLYSWAEKLIVLSHAFAWAHMRVTSSSADAETMEASWLRVIKGRLCSSVLPLHSFHVLYEMFALDSQSNPNNFQSKLVFESTEAGIWNPFLAVSPWDDKGREILEYALKAGEAFCHDSLFTSNLFLPKPFFDPQDPELKCPRSHSEITIADRATRQGPPPLSAYTYFWNRAIYGLIKSPEAPGTLTSPDGTELRVSGPIIVAVETAMLELFPSRFIHFPDFATLQFLDLKEQGRRLHFPFDLDEFSGKVKDRVIKSVSHTTIMRPNEIPLCLCDSEIQAKAGYLILQKNLITSIKYGRLRWKDVYLFEHHLILVPQKAPTPSAVLSVPLEDISVVMYHPKVDTPGLKHRSAALTVHWAMERTHRDRITNLKILFDDENELGTWAGFLALWRRNELRHQSGPSATASKETIKDN